jgi:hypothetical protein
VPNCIIGPLNENIYTEHYKDIKVIKTDKDAIFDKGLYYCLEKISEVCSEKKSCIIIYGAFSNCAHKAFNSLNSIYRLIQNYDQTNIDIFIIAENTVSAVLSRGMNIVTLPNDMITRYSVNIVDGDAYVSIFEEDNDGLNPIMSKLA